jgi:hypothetical protein
MGRIQGISLPRVPEQQLIAQFANDTSLSIAAEYHYVQATCLTLTVPLVLS